jgi:hypothetical protein
MYKFLFKNRLAAVAFVLITMVSVKVLIGSEGEESVLSRTQDDLMTQRDGMQAAIDNISMAQEPEPQFDEGPIEEIMPDEELIDDTAGFDPTPEGDEELIADEEVVVEEEF